MPLSFFSFRNERTKTYPPYSIIPIDSPPINPDRKSDVSVPPNNVEKLFTINPNNTMTMPVINGFSLFFFLFCFTKLPPFEKSLINLFWFIRLFYFNILYSILKEHICADNRAGMSGCRAAE